MSLFSMRQDNSSLWLCKAYFILYALAAREEIPIFMEQHNALIRIHICLWTNKEVRRCGNYEVITMDTWYICSYISWKWHMNGEVSKIHGANICPMRGFDWLHIYANVLKNGVVIADDTQCYYKHGCCKDQNMLHLADITVTRYKLVKKRNS